MRIVKSFFFVACLLAVSLLHAKEPDVFYYFHPKACEEMAFARQLTSLPEWKQFWSLFCDAIDKGIQKELTDRRKLEEHLPPKFVDMLISVIEKPGFSFRNVIGKVGEHLEAVVFMVETTPPKKIDGVFALILNVDPSQGLAWLPMIEDIKEGEDYWLLKRGPDSDFILKAVATHDGKSVEFCCAGLKLPGNDYRFALLFSDEANIQRYFETFKAGQTGEEHAKGCVEKFVVGDRCFRVLETLGQQYGWDAKAMEIFKKTRNLELSCRDDDGATRIKVQLSLQQADDAKAARDMLAGYIALVQFSTDAREISSLLQTINIELDDTDVLVEVTLDHPKLWELLSNILSKASDEIKKKN